MSTKKKSSSLTFWMVILGFLTGLFFVLIGLIIQLASKLQTFSWQSLVELHIENKALIWFDFLPFFLAILFRIIAGYHDELATKNLQWESLAERHTKSITKLNAEIRQKEQEREKAVRERIQLENAVDAVEDLVILVDTQGMITHCNLATPMAFRLGFDHLIGHPIEEFLPGITPGAEVPLPNTMEMQFPGKEDKYQVTASALLMEGAQQGMIYTLRNLAPKKLVEGEVPFSVTREGVEMAGTVTAPIEEAAQQTSMIPTESVFTEGEEEAMIAPEEISLDVVEEEVVAETQPVPEEKESPIHPEPEIIEEKVVDEVIPQPTAPDEWVHVPPELPIEKHSVVPTEEIVTEASAVPAVGSVFLSNLHRIEPVYAQKLADVGITTTQDLLTSGATRKGREDLVVKTGISAKLILGFVNLADLLRVPGLSESHVELLEAVGVNTLRDLQKKKPQVLFNVITNALEEKPIVKPPPRPSEVEAWVNAARDLKPLVSY